jgi:hypothetical protein
MKKMMVIRDVVAERVGEELANEGAARPTAVRMFSSNGT